MKPVTLGFVGCGYMGQMAHITHYGIADWTGQKAGSLSVLRCLQVGRFGGLLNISFGLSVETSNLERQRVMDFET